MKRYLMFGFDTYYPGGGMNDFIFDFDTVDEMKKEIKKINKNKHWEFQNYNAIDTETGKIFGGYGTTARRVGNMIKKHEEESE